MGEYLDSLVARAARQLERPEPTETELVRELEEVLDELENGYPDEGRSRTLRLRLLALQLRATDPGHILRDPRPSLTVIHGARDDA